MASSFPPSTDRSLVRRRAAGPGLRRLFACLVLPFVWACGDREPSEPRASDRSSADATDPGGTERDRIFDREFAFVSDAGAPVILVPWFFRTRAGELDALREHRVWLAGPTGWETLAHEAAELPATRSPWRILPGERVRIVVGEAERVEALVFRGPSRELETRPREFVTEWSPSPGEVIRLFRGETVLPSGTADGFVLDVTRAWETAGDLPGDWIFLHGGDDVQFFMDETTPLESSRTSGRYRGWSRVQLRDAQWPTIEVGWGELRSFERARRDIPGRWSFASPGEEVVGELRSVSAQLIAEEGDGPLLPVTGLFEVEGTLRLEGREFDVIGLVRHVQH